MQDQAFPFSDHPETPRPQVLMLMNDPVLDGLYRNRLQAADYCLVWCDSVKDWKAAVQSFKYDIVVADLGFLRADEQAPLQELIGLASESEIIILTEDENVRLAISAFQMGVADYFLKPVNPEILLWAIQKAVQKRALATSNQTLSEDIRLFNILHQLSVAESETKKRSIAIRKLLELLGARGGLWARPGESISSDCEYYLSPKEEGQAAFLQFLARNPNWVEKSFESSLTNHPENWITGSEAWIPLNSPWMGGIFVFGISTEASPALRARVEFLVRNLEIALENHSRFVKARQLSYIDDLTGLYNSRYLEAAVTAAIDRYQKSRQGFAILFIDVDRFKSVNDTHGHLVGSRLLVETAHLLKRLLRKPDHLFRYGGDEFIALLYGAEMNEAMQSAERLRGMMEKHRFLIHKASISITLSIGVARFPDHGTETAQVIQLADEAMYEGKKAGRNSVFLAPQKTQTKIAA